MFLMLILQIKLSLQYRQIVFAEKPVLEFQALFKSVVFISNDSAIKVRQKHYKLEFEPCAFPLHAMFFSASGHLYMVFLLPRILHVVSPFLYNSRFSYKYQLKCSIHKRAISVQPSITELRLHLWSHNPLRLYYVAFVTVIIV